MAGGFISTLLIAAVSGTRGWPWASLTAEPWFIQFNTQSQASVRYSLLIAFYLGVAGLCASWWRMLSASRRGDVSIKQVYITIALWMLPILFATPLFSGDAYVYYADGQALMRGYDPYNFGISSMGPAPMTYMIHPLWRDTTTMYGPLFMQMAHLIVLITPNSIVTGVLLFRLFAVLSIAVMAVSVTSIAKRLDLPVTDGLVFGLLNPITLLHLVGGAHNDAEMLAFLTAALAIGLRAGRSWRTLAIVLCACAGAFKVPGLAGALVLGWMWAGADAGRSRRLVGAALGGVGVLVSFELITLLTGSNWGWLNALDVPGLAHPVLSPPNALALSFGGLFSWGYPLNTVTRDIATVASLAIGVFMIVRTDRKAPQADVLRGMGWAMLGLGWLGPAVYPWYLTWGFVLVGLTGAKAMRKPLMTAVVLVSFAIAPGGYGLMDLFTGWRGTAFAFLATALLSAAVYQIIRRNNLAWPKLRPPALSWRAPRTSP